MANYTWSEDAKIELTGQEFNVIFNGLVAFMNQPLTPNSYVVTGNILQILQAKFKSMIESGIATEVVEESEDPKE